MDLNLASSFGSGTIHSEMSIIDAIDANDTDAAIQWIEKTNDLNAKVRHHRYGTEWPLKHALRKNQPKIALALLAHGASVLLDTGDEKFHALAECIRGGDLETVRMILHLHPSCVSQRMKSDGMVPIRLAARCGSSSYLRIPFQNGANVDYQNKFTGEGPLHVAAEGSRLAAAETLRFEVRDKNSRRPLDVAVMSANSGLVKTLFQSGIAATLNIEKCKSGFTLALGLQFDAKYGIIETFLDRGFDMNNDAALSAEILRVASQSHDLEAQESETCRLLIFLLDKGLAAVGPLADPLAETALKNYQYVLVDKLVGAGSQSPPAEDPYFADLPKKRLLLLQHLKNTTEEKSPQLWLWNCLSRHSTCNRSCWSVPTLPHRVIDVGVSLASTQTFLHESRGQRDYYVTLSHPWSISAPLKTILKNIDDFKVSIPWSSLSPLLKDAILWTRRLGVRYLWIDSLCIVQDSEIDWITEASTMSTTYRQSLVTLAAVGSESEDCTISPEIRSLGKNFSSLSVTGSTLTSFKPNIGGDFLSAQRPSGVLDSRGWTFQEQILAPRTLSFTSKGVFWECLTISASPSQPHGCPKQQGQGWEVREARIFKEILLTGTILSINLPKPVPLTVILLSHWRHIIKAYSSRSFTRRTDRFMALKGITDLMQSVSGRRFRAGLWEDTLPRDLLWFVDGRLPPTRDPLIQAPSRSWFSIDARVSFDWHWQAVDGKDPMVDSRITLKHIEFEMNAATSYARGSIRLSGQLLSLEYLKQFIAQREKDLDEEERKRDPRFTATGYGQRKRSSQAFISCDYKFDTLCSRKCASHGLVVGQSAGRTLCLLLIPVQKAYEFLSPNSITAQGFIRAGILIIDGDMGWSFQNMSHEQVVLL